MGGLPAAVSVTLILLMTGPAIDTQAMESQPDSASQGCRIGIVKLQVSFYLEREV